MRDDRPHRGENLWCKRWMSSMLIRRPGPFRGILLGLGLVWLALGLRFGLVWLVHDLGFQGRALGILLLALGLLGVEWLTRPVPERLAPRPRRGFLGLSVFPVHFREEWGGDLEEVCGQWRERGCMRWSIYLWRLGWIAQLVETWVRFVFYAVIYAPIWKKP